jgi:hypothetical protein
MGLFKPNVEKLEEKKNVKGLIKALRYKYWHVRQKAAEALGKIGDEKAVEPLIQALEDGYSYVQEEAARALGKIGDKRAVVPLLRASRGYQLGYNLDVSWVARWALGKTLGKIGEPAVEPLIQALKNEHWSVREGAAEALGEIGSTRAVEPLIQALKDEDSYEDSYVRRKAARALGEIRSTRAVEPLIQALKDEDWCVRQEAAEALGKIGDEKAVEPLIQVLKDEDEGRVLGSAAEALGEIGSEEATETLIRFLESDKFLKFLKDDEFRSSVIEALGKTRNKKAVNPLLSILDSIALALGRKYYSTATESKGIITPLVLELKKKILGVLWSDERKAIESLAEIGDKKCVERVLRWLFVERKVGVERAWDKSTQIKDIKQDFFKMDAVKYRNLFEDYTDFIFEALFIPGIIEREHIMREDPSDPGYVHYYKYNLDSVEKAIEELGKIRTPVSNNLLHLIAQREDIEVITEIIKVWGDLPPDQFGPPVKEELLNLQRIREMAKEELARRGNPPYNPSAYLIEEGWKLWPKRATNSV